MTDPDPATSLARRDFDALGAYADAGLRATALALQRAARSFEQGRIPIAGAAVQRGTDGELQVVTVGHNGRIAAPGAADDGYPTDHGETAAIRAIEDLDAVDWRETVFATTLSPCIMCGRTLQTLHARGLDKLVIAEAESFAGTRDMLARLPGMTIVALRHPGAMRMMQTFARRYPWDWAADIGEVPPRIDCAAGGSPTDAAYRQRLLAAASGLLEADREPQSAAAVVDAAGQTVVACRDELSGSGHNPTRSAVMLAIGRAGAGTNLRECGVVFARRVPGPIDVGAFGPSSLGACELFRPAFVLATAPLAPELSQPLQRAGIVVHGP